MGTMTTVIDLTGRTFGQLTVIRREPRPNPRAFWLCRCECGTDSVKMGKYLLCGDTRSCGCAQVKSRAAGNPKHGGASSGKLLPEYVAWRSAKERCCNPNKATFKHYGGRGIRMCERWLYDFGAFLSDMGPRPAGHSLDRINANGDYEPSNCRWATQEQQTNNQRRNVRVTWQGTERTLAEVAKLTRVDYRSLHYHLRVTKSVVDAVSLAMPR